MRFLFLRFNSWISKGSGLGGYIRIPDWGRSIHNNHKITTYSNKGHSHSDNRHSGQEDNIAHYHEKAVPAPAPEALTPYFSLHNPDRRVRAIA